MPVPLAALMKLLTILAMSAFLMAGCSGGSGPATPEQDGEGRYVIHMTASGNRFDPADAKVPANATVVWVNDGAAPHNVVAEDQTFNSDRDNGAQHIRANEEYEYHFNKTGTFHYVCHLHSGMEGTITVG
jgi:plastocyanin